MNLLSKLIYNILFFSIIFYLCEEDFASFTEPSRSVLMIAFAVSLRGLDHYLTKRFIDKE